MSYRFVLLSIVLIMFSCNSENKKQIDGKDYVRGVWIAAPEHNSVTHSYKNIKESVELYERTGINTIYLCSWANAKTSFKSQVLLENSSYKNIEETCIFEDYNYISETNDPLRDIIDLAHEKGIKVILWFEYGFMSKWSEEPTIHNDVILAKNEHWASVNSHGETAHYHNDYYYNSFHPEVQNFLLLLISEAFEKYPDIDGIQGDDRMPASPVDSGYDDYSKEEYLKFSGLDSLPKNYLEPKWFNWRLNKLNQFAEKINQTVKSFGEEKIVAFSPNPYPWCKDNLMQDFPNWIKNNYVDLLSVQIYRSDFKKYKNDIDSLQVILKENANQTIISPGVLLGVGDKKRSNGELLDSIINYNRKAGISGESFFYARWINDDEFNKVIKNHYQIKE